ncbi:LysE family translocator [Xenorhabdus bovienii]|uniref:LysE family translocator n=1 Tax=Xenorhabdus bovienii TaxID=40576 RepID=UPI0023B290F8|nr:LysE family translocator [Xenorhabdus bovienii]MDE9454867.1 LysE family translocator [Xenorhabdus bovienii]MDE9482776.1 LysE family translocator [Xenorhabdus bovienii]MDE9543629.1 LysE family translocator [Xenorhabdus bovienii]MDE9556097.1 LysE family translocator [Xenorhabdus bovienii]MDE9564716.1 LysE family translocator [Xenorhabdus bovienii]
MTASLIFSLSTFLLISAITPGPNNMLLTSSGANFGFRRSLPLWVGILLGIQTILLLSAFGVGAVLLLYPTMHTVLKVLGSLYLLRLAWKTSTAHYKRLETANLAAVPIKGHQGWLLQFLNPKAWMMGLGAVGSYSLQGDLYNHSVVVISVVMLVSNMIAGTVWIVLGSLIGSLLKSRNAWFIFNITMGILTAVCVPLLWIS